MSRDQEYRLWAIVFMAAALAGMDASGACMLAAGAALFLAFLNNLSNDDES